MGSQTVGHDWATELNWRSMRSVELGWYGAFGKSRWAVKIHTQYPDSQPTSGCFPWEMPFPEKESCHILSTSSKLQVSFIPIILTTYQQTKLSYFHVTDEEIEAPRCPSHITKVRATPGQQRGDPTPEWNVEWVAKNGCCQPPCPQGKSSLSLASLRGFPKSGNGMTQSPFKLLPLYWVLKCVRFFAFTFYLFIYF